MVNRAKLAKVWSILADETTDRQKREQMVFVCRYLWKNGNEYIIREDPFSIISALEEAEAVRLPEQAGEKKLDGQTLGRLIVAEISKSSLGKLYLSLLLTTKHIKFKTLLVRI